MIELLEDLGKFVPMRATARVYGSVLGIARETHARSALKRLYEREITSDTGIGDFWEREITPKQR
jgi:hypothetical protein